MNSEHLRVGRFAARVTTFLLLQVFVLAVVLRYGSPKHNSDYLGAFQDKIDRLERCRGTRLVILGGSNAAFGVHSPVMQDSTGIETVNLGLQVALGLSFMLESYRQHARSGDIVVLCPEYHMLTNEALLDGDPLMVSRLIEQCPRAKNYLPGAQPSTWKQFLDQDAIAVAHQWVGRAFRTIRKQEKDDKDEVYSRQAFNDFGDVVAHHGRTSKDWIPMSPVPEIREETLQDTIAILNRFHSDCRQRGVTVYLSYPPLVDTAFAESQPVIDQLHLALEKDLQIPILHPPQAFVYSRESFYDSGYHLTHDAGQARTRYMAEAIHQQHVAAPKLARNQPRGDDFAVHR